MISLPQDVLSQAFDSLPFISLNERERLGTGHIDFISNDDLPDEGYIWRSIDSFSRKVLIIRYLEGFIDTQGQNTWHDGVKVQAIFQRYTDNEDDWRGSMDNGHFFGSSATVSQEQRSLLKDMLEGNIVKNGNIVARCFL